MSKSLIEQIKELLKHIEINPNALNKFEKDFYFQALKKAKIIDFKTKQTLADEGEPLLPSPPKGKLTGVQGEKKLPVTVYDNPDYLNNYAVIYNDGKDKHYFFMNDHQNSIYHKINKYIGSSDDPDSEKYLQAWMSRRTKKLEEIPKSIENAIKDRIKERKKTGTNLFRKSDIYDIKIDKKTSNFLTKKTLKEKQEGTNKSENYYRNLVKTELAKAKIIDLKSKQTLADLPTDKPKTTAIPRLPGSLTPDTDVDRPGHDIVTSESKPHKIKVGENLYDAYVRHYGDGSYDVEVDHENPPDEAYDIGWDHFEKLGYMSGHGFNEQGEPDLPVPPEAKKTEDYYRNLVKAITTEFLGNNPEKPSNDWESKEKDLLGKLKDARQKAWEADNIFNEQLTPTQRDKHTRFKHYKDWTAPLFGGHRQRLKNFSDAYKKWTNAINDYESHMRIKDPNYELPEGRPHPKFRWMAGAIKSEDYYRNLVKTELAKAKIIDFKTRQTLADEGKPLLPSPAKGKLTGVEGGGEFEKLKSGDLEAHRKLSEKSQNPEIQAKLLEIHNPLKNPKADPWIYRNLAIYSNNPEIHRKLLESKDPVVHQYLALFAEHPEIQSKLLENSNDPEVIYALQRTSQHPKIKQKAYDKLQQLQQKTNKSETYYKDLVESTLEKAKKSKKPFHGYNPKKHAKTGGLNDKYRKKLNRETGSNLKRPSKDKSNSRHKSFCARMKGVKGPTSKEGKLTPKGAALKRWNCSKNEHSDESLCKKDRCWVGYEPTPGKKPYSKGSCRPIKKNDYFSSLIKKTLKHD